MKHILAGGLLIGLLCGLWTFVMGLTGWYKDPSMMVLFYAVILVQIGVLIVHLRRTAADGRGYGPQVLAGTMMSVIGGVMLIFISLLFTTVAYPEYFEEIRRVQEELLREAGRTDDEIAAEIALMSGVQTPAIQAMFGFLGTLVTGVLSSLIIAAFIRKK